MLEILSQNNTDSSSRAANASHFYSLFPAHVGFCRREGEVGATRNGSSKGEVHPVL